MAYWSNQYFFNPYFIWRYFSDTRPTIPGLFLQVEWDQYHREARNREVECRKAESKHSVKSDSDQIAEKLRIKAEREARERVRKEEEKKLVSEIVRIRQLEEFRREVELKTFLAVMVVEREKHEREEALVIMERMKEEEAVFMFATIMAACE